MNHDYVVKHASKVDLSDISTKAPDGITHEEALQRTEKLGAELDELEELMYAAGQTGLLIVLQGRDTSGKDGAIRHLLRFVNVQSCRVHAFKVPTEEERAHDFLWRVHQRTPQLGGVTIFNRSHYEDVIVVRVHDLVPKHVWSGRYEQINAFEKTLTEAGVVVLKFYLHISKEEQKERLLEREADPVKAWKLSAGDWKERELWDDYTEAFEDALSKCSTENAPWVVVPADNKWYRDLILTHHIVEALKPYRTQWMERLDEIGKAAKAEITAYRAESSRGSSERP